MVRKFLALIAIAIPLTLVACGGSDSSSSTTAASDTGATSTTQASTTAASGGSSGAGGSVAISETEFQLDPSDPSTKAGKVTFDVKNDGTVVHDLEIEGNGVQESTDPIGAGIQREAQRRPQARHLRDLLQHRQPP